MLAASVLICTRNRKAALGRCLESVLRAAVAATPSEVEVVVVDDGSTDGTAELVRAVAAEAPVPLRLVAGAGRGLSAARNAGLAETRGGLIVFVDDDCLMPPDHLRRLLAAFEADEGPVLRGGRVELADPQDAALTIKTSREPQRLAPRQHPGGFILGCNMAIPREIIAGVGLFDERFGAGGFLRSAEDTDYLLRAQLAGFPVVYAPDLVVFHAHGRRTRDQVRRVQRDYSIGDGALTLKHSRRAPWLWRVHYWAARNAVREMLGGPRYDRDWRLSHRRLVLHSLIGAILFLISKIQRRRTSPAAALERLQDASEPATARAAARTQPERSAPAAWRGAGPLLHAASTGGARGR